MSDPRPHLLIHGYGLLDVKYNLVAGSRMSGLTLYTTILVDGLAPSYKQTFLCGCLDYTELITRALRQDLSVVEYSALFPSLLEREGQFEPQAARSLYQDRVAEQDNPIYASLACIYARIVLDIRPHLINAHNPNAVCAALHAVLSGVDLPPILATIHDVNPIQIRFISRNQDYIALFVAISGAVKTKLVAAGISPQRIRTIPNGVVLQPFLEVGDIQWQDVAQSHGLREESAFTILVPARRVPGKGIDIAICAFDKLYRRRQEPMRLLISGAGLAEPVYEAELRALALSLKARHRIHFLDAVAYEELPALFRVCDVSLLPSTVPEGFGYANIEAMATAGPVVVTTAHGGPLDYMIDGHNGILVPPGDVDAIADALERVLDAPRDFAAVRSAARATAIRYPADAMIASYDTCIQDLLSRRPA